MLNFGNTHTRDDADASPNEAGAGATISYEALPAAPRRPAWTPADVRRWLIATFLSLPNAPIYSLPGGGISSTARNVPDATFCWIGFLNEVISDRVIRLSLLIWAKSEAAREVKRRRLRIEIPRASISDACREYGWHRKTFDRRVEAALKKLAEERTRRDAAWAAA